VSAAFEPNDEFVVVDQVPHDDELAKMGYPDWFMYGLLDILMTSEAMPLTNVKVMLCEAKYDKVDSSPRAFLEAGRDAGRKLREVLKSRAKTT
jgi:hypothetical protein